MIEGFFGACLLLLAYTYLGYPALMAVLARLRPRLADRKPIRPTVSLLIVAYNEARWIRRKLENCLALAYPKVRLELVIASDGSTDGSIEIARQYEPLGLTVIEFETRRGKPAVLNDVVSTLRGDIVLFSDARQLYHPQALIELVKNFADPSVGAVSGDLVLTNELGTKAAEGVALYWRYEKFIRRNESCVDSTMGATGAIYAIRRELFQPIPEDTILDDVLIPMRIAARGYRILFESRAMAYDLVAPTAAQEFTRKVRTISGNFQLFCRQRWLLNPLRNRLWFQTVSHKGLRLASPLFLAAVLIANLFLLNHPVYRWTLGVQILFYGAALGGYTAQNAGRKIPLLSLPYIFCLLNWASLVAFLTFATGRHRVTWEKAAA